MKLRVIRKAGELHGTNGILSRLHPSELKNWTILLLPDSSVLGYKNFENDSIGDALFYQRRGKVI